MIGAVCIGVTIAVWIAARRWPNNRTTRIVGLAWPAAIAGGGAAIMIWSAASAGDLAIVGILAGSVFAVLGIAVGLANRSYFGRFTDNASAPDPI